MAIDYLREEDKLDIFKTIISIFGQETSKSVIFDFERFKNEIDQTIKEMSLETYSYIDKWNFSTPIEVIRRKMGSDVSKKNYLAMKGFLLIFKFREFLFKNSIDYRYYYSDGNIVKSKTFGEVDLLELTKFNDNQIVLDTKKIKDKAAEGDSFFTSKMNQYYNIYTSPEKNKYMKKIESAKYNLRIVRRQIMSKYGEMNPGLLSKDGTKYQTFNSGHIYESLDITIIDSFQKHGEKEMNNYIDQYMFGKYLKRDRVVASKGGDNFLTNTSVKSNEANLYSFKTISNQLYIIQQMLKTTDSETLKHDIYELFIDDSEKLQDISKDLEISANRAVKILKAEIQKSLQP